MKSFLQYVAKDILAKHPEGLSDVAIVFPNKRASLFFNQALYEETGKPLWSPAYITISELFRRHSQLKVPDQILLIFKLYNTFCDVVGTDEPLDHFYSWGQMLLADFDDLDKNMADADKLFINLEAWQELKDFSFLSEAQKESLEKFFGKMMDKTEMQQHFNDVWRHLAKIYHEYKQNLVDEGLAYEGMLYRNVVETEQIDFQYKHYIFIGFNLLQKVEQQLFRKLKMRGMAEFYWDYDEYYINNNNEAGKYIAKYIDKFPNELSHTRVSNDLLSENIYNNMASPKDITYISAPTENIQARYVSEWLKQGNRIEAGSRTAIVLGDESLLENVIHCLPEEVENVNITTGYPLASSPVSTLVNLLLNLQLRGKVERTDKYRLKFVNQILRHPYAKYISDDCLLLLNELNTHKQYFPNRKLLTTGYDEAMNDLFADVRANKGKLPILAWVATILKRVGIGAREEKNPLMHESVFRMYTLINRLDEIMIPTTAEFGLTFGNVDEESGKQLVSVAILQRLMTQMIQSTTIPFHGEPLLGIQIMGVLETRNLDFDHVLLLSCNEGNLPRNVNDASFIPHSLRAGYELTTIENKVGIYAYYFYSLLQRAKDVTFTYNNSTDDGQRGEMSRFMLQFMVENGEKQHMNYKTLQSGQDATLIRRLPIEKDDVIKNKLDAIERLSPSAINRYLRCPLQFYYNTVCHLREENNDDEDEIDNVMFGNIFHKTAELIYLDLSNHYKKAITADAITLLQKDKLRIERHLDQAFREILFKVNDNNFRPQYNGLQRLNKKAVKLYIDRLLALDKQLAPFDILALEDSFYDNLTFEVQGKERTISVGGQIDRLDCIMKNGKPVIRVVDYKTGTPLSSIPSKVEDIFEPKYIDTKHAAYYLQAFLYAGIIRHGENALATINKRQLPVSPALFFIRQTASANYNPTLKIGTGKNKEEIDDIDIKYKEFMVGLKGLLENIFDSSQAFQPTEDGTRCTTCPYNNICGL
ncbi:MAG: PD-(D/E)XK nuclease family protein [Prevotella sp.]|jgi:CRISPR/Cas system-associated exonuclease Cas4 (RecB family)